MFRVGDERPCQRCIKRGLADACQDGVRKKAKYLHDAPNEALMPGVGATIYTHPSAERSNSQAQNDGQAHKSAQSHTHSTPQQQFFPNAQPFGMYPPSSQMPPPNMQDRAMSSTSFSQPSPLTPAFGMTGLPPVQSPHDQTSAGTAQHAWSNMPGALFDDASLYNFDISQMGFGNQYGALEFGMLGQMATNAGDTPPSETTTTRGSVHQPYRVPIGSFSESPNSNSFPYNDAIMSDWSNNSSVYNLPGQSQAPHAFAIESNAHFTSPETHQTPPDGMKFDDSPLFTQQTLTDPAMKLSAVPSSMSPHKQRPQHPASHITTPQLKARTQLPTQKTKRPRDPTSIYTSVTTPHPYTANFHSLLAYLQRRFASHPSRTLAIAKSLAKIRPSFIATTKTLNRDDLIFMEKCFQRTLFEYEGFIEGVGTPTIVARRTGEIAAVGKEFSILTGWRKDVLLGRAPNLNVNRGHSGATPEDVNSGTNTAGKAGTGWNTPTPRDKDGQHVVDDGGGAVKRDKPVFLAELLDDESVVTFYEDFARLAFGDSRGSVFRKGKLLKYRTREEEIKMNLQREADSRSGNGGLIKQEVDKRRDGSVGWGVDKRNREMKKEGISGEKGMQKLGSADGKVDCAYCWTVKRDVFEVPMLIVMNVSAMRF